MKGYIIATVVLILLFAIPFFLGHIDIFWARGIGVIMALLGVVMAFVLGTVMTSGLESFINYGLVLIITGATLVVLTYVFPVGL